MILSSVNYTNVNADFALLVYLGPYSPFAHGSAFPAIEHTTIYLLRLLFKFQTECYKAVEPKQEAMDDFIDHADRFLKRTVFAANCRSWFKGGMSIYGRGCLFF
jgi:hypothetical protein